MDAKAIGQRLVKLRGSRTQDEVSKGIGTSLSAIGMYERGERIPRDEVKLSIAKYYDTTVQAIFMPMNDTYCDKGVQYAKSLFNERRSYQKQGRRVGCRSTIQGTQVVYRFRRNSGRDTSSRTL